MRSAQASIVELDKGKRYRVFVEAGRDAITGQRKRLTKVVRGSRKDAEKVKTELLVKAGSMRVVTGMTFSDYVRTMYLPEMRKKVDEGTRKRRSVEAYEDCLRLHILPIIGNVPLLDLSPTHIARMQDAAAKPTIAKEARKVASAILGQAVYDHLITENPVKGARPPEMRRYDPDVLDLEDVEVYLWHFRGMRSEPVVLLAIGGCFRRGEICALDVDDINVSTGVVTVDDAFVQAKGGVSHEETKTRRKRRVALPGSITDRLARCLPSEGPVMQGAGGRRLAPATVLAAYKRDLSTLPDGVPRITLKNLRHTGLTLAYDATGDIKAVSGHGGHSNSNTTEKHYVRPHDDREIALAKSVDDLLRSKAVMAHDGTRSCGMHKK